MSANKIGKMLSGSCFLWVLLSAHSSYASRPGDNDFCSNNHIYACRVETGKNEGETIVTCFDSEGKERYKGKHMPCDRIHNAHAFQKYISPCYYQAEFLKLFPSLITLLMRPDSIPQNPVCLNFERNIASFELNDSKYTYTMEKESSAPEPGTTWKLKISPPKRELLRTTEYPFLLCKNYHAFQAGEWDFSVQESQQSLEITYKRQTLHIPPSPENGFGTLDRISKKFITCDNNVSETNDK